MLLSNLLIETQARLGTSVKTRLTTPKQTFALNTVRKRLLLEYDIANFIKEDDITITSGDGTLPTDYIRTTKELDKSGKEKTLWLTSNDDEIYKKVSIERFDDNIDRTWATKQDTAGATFSIYEAGTDTYTMRYYFMPDNMSDSADDSGLPIHFDEIHPLLAARQLLFDDRQFESAAQLKAEADRLLSAHFKNQRMDGGAKRTSSFHSGLLGSVFIA